MSAIQPKNLIITVNTNSGGTVTTKTITVAIAANLTDGSLPGLFGPDVSIRNIHKAGGFWDYSVTPAVWYARADIQSITWS